MVAQQKDFSKLVTLFEREHDVRYPVLLRRKMIRENGFTWGKWLFFRILEDGNLAKKSDSDKIPGYVVIAGDNRGQRLALSTRQDGMVYLFGVDVFDVYAETEAILAHRLEKEELLEQISENLPAIQPFLINIRLHTDHDDQEKVLSFTSAKTEREHLFIIRGEVREEELLIDAIERELKEGMGIDGAEVMDIFEEEADEQDEEGNLIPTFTVPVKVPYFTTQDRSFAGVDLIWTVWEED